MMRAMSWVIRSIAAFVLMVLCTATGAQTAPQGSAPDVTLKSLRALLEQMPASADTEAEVESLNALTDNILARAERFVAARTAQVADLNARLGELGPPPAAGGTAESLDVTQQRVALEKERNALDADIRLARLMSVNAQQRRAELLAQRRAVFQAQLLDHSDPPLRDEFWRQARTDWNTDRVRLRTLAAELEVGLTTALRGASPTKIALGALGVFAFIAIALRVTEIGLTRLAARTFPIGRLRRSLLAFLNVLAYVLITGLVLSLAWDQLEEVGRWGTQSMRLVDSAVKFGMFLAFVIALGRSLLANGHGSWRLPPITDAFARRLAPVAWLFAIVALVSWLPIALNEVFEAPLNSVVSNLAPTVAFVVACVVGLVLLRQPMRGPYTEEQSRESTTRRRDLAFARPAKLGLLMAVIVALLVVLLVMVIAGYLALARVIAGQATWAGIVLASAYLLFKFVDDLSMALLSSRSRFGQRVQKGLGTSPQTLDQAAVLVSGLGRVTVFFYMAVAFVAPLGSTPGQLFQRSGKYGSSLKVGQFELVPGTILSFVSVLVLGFIVVRLFKRWLSTSYLPHTKLEPEMRSSVTTLLGYVGVVLVITLALSALGISINRIAWIASALSVGIGFGLQAIVQNFISGLILMAERPVKVGDWVVLGASEGDVRRINVRATEIQLGDRSTLIVPNSEFITKTVRNMTMRNAEGRVLIRLPMPLTTDVRRVRDLMLEAFLEHDQVLREPAPSVALDGIENGLLIFQGIAYVPSPRKSAAVRGDILFAMVERLQAAQVPMPMPTDATVSGSTAPGPRQPAPSPPPSPLLPGTTD